ncbi:MAG: hypothetical protein ACR2GQ_11480 [Gemmatimonadota bacterium]
MSGTRARSAYRFVSLAVLAPLLLMGCASATSIGELLDDPGRYDGKTVSVEGEVGSAVGGLGMGAYRVQDDSGTLTVLSDVGSPPRDGAKIRVKGVFSALFTIGSQGVAVLREESRSRP